MVKSCLQHIMHNLNAFCAELSYDVPKGFMKEQSAASKLLRGTIVIVLVSVLAKIVTFITEAILANYLGTTWQSDAYYMVTSIQNVIYPMLSVGIWKVYLPIYKEKITLGETDLADDLTDQVITVFSAVSIVVVSILMIFSSGVVSVIAPGFEGQISTW